MDKKVYFAAPLFNAAEKGFNLKLTEMLENAGYSVFLPQRDGNEAALMTDMTEGEKSAAIFCADKDALLDADILFMVIDGRVPDEAHAWSWEWHMRAANGATASGRMCAARNTVWT